MEKVKYLEREVERLEARLGKSEAHCRALERVVRDVIADAAKGAFEFAVRQYRWQEEHQAHEA